MSLYLQIKNEQDEEVGKILFENGKLAVYKVIEGNDFGAVLTLEPEIALLLGDELSQFYYDNDLSTQKPASSS